MTSSKKTTLIKSGLAINFVFVLNRKDLRDHARNLDRIDDSPIACIYKLKIRRRFANDSLPALTGDKILQLNEKMATSQAHLKVAKLKQGSTKFSCHFQGWH